MAKKIYAEALVDGLYISMEKDPQVSLIGRHVLGLSPLRTLMDPIREAFADRIYDPPISEAGITALGVGAAMAGARPFIDIATASFVFEAWPQLVNEAANARYMSGGQFAVPAVFHMLHGLRGGGAAQHSHSPQSMLWNCPGLEIVLPSSPRDVKGLIRTAIKSDNPTVFIDHGKLFNLEGDVPEGDYEIPFGQAEIKRGGGDVTLVATSLMVQVALEAADALSGDGIEAEVVDPRTIVPFDKETIFESVAKTGRLVVIDECNLSCGIASEISATVTEFAFDSLKAPIIRVTRPDVPVPFSQPLEDYITPTQDKVIAAVRKIVG